MPSFIKVLFCTVCAFTIMGCQIKNNLMPQRKVQPSFHNEVKRTRSGKLIVVPPKCPHIYDADGRLDLENNWGCSTTQNLGVMLDDPRDLLPQPSRQVYAAKPLAHAVQNYRDSKQKKLDVKDITDISLSQ